MKTLIKIFIGIVALLIFPEFAFNQAFLKSVNPGNYEGNYKEMVKQIDMFYDTATGSNRGGYKQWKRWEWFANYHLDVKGELVDYAEKNFLAVEELKKNTANNSRSHTGDWSNLGHSSLPGDEAKMGRVNCVAFDPVNSSIVYVAAAGGGIWKTFNNGDTWTNLTVDLPILGIADIVVSPAPNNHIVYALTGDVTGGANVYTHLSLGVIKSFDGGLSWTRTNFTIPPSQNIRGYKLLMHPTNSNILLAAMSDGIHRTMDGGNTWTLFEAVANVNDIEFDLNNLDSVYYSVRNSGILTRISLSSGNETTTLVGTGIDRMEIAVTADNPKAVYVLCGPGYQISGNNLFIGLFYSGNSGLSFTMRTNFCSNNGTLFFYKASYSWYVNTIYVDPFEENNVIVGGLNLFNSSDGGINLTQVTANSIHSDQHNLKRNPLNGDVWLCNDGGVYRSTDNGTTWNNRSNGLLINEYYRISGTNNADDLMLGGTQDNGHFLRDGAGNFYFVLGSDGMDNYFNSFNNTIAYACRQNGELARSVDGQPFLDTTLPDAGNGNFYPWLTPIIQQPPYNTGPPFYFWENTDVIYVYSLGGIMRSTDGATWPNIGPPGIGSQGVGPSMAICSDGEGSTNLYISNGKQFWACFNPLDEVPNWNLFALPISNTTFISSIAVNPANRTEVWVTISGYEAGTKVFRSQNSGLTWSNLSLSLPNTPVYSIVFANNINSPSGAVYVGTEIGVFYTDDGVPDWVPFSNGLPHVPVTDLSMNYVTHELKAATFGRGVWESDIYESCPSLILVDFDINQGQYNFESSDLIYANNFIRGGIGVKVNMKAANQIKLVNGFKTFPDSYVHISIGTCGSGVVDLTTKPSDPTKSTAGGKVNKTSVKKD